MTNPPVATHSRGLTLQEYRAFGQLANLTGTPHLRDVIVQCGRLGGEVWIDRGAGLERDDGLRPSPEQVRHLATGLISAGGRHIDELHPFADVRLGDGIRVHAVLAPLVRDGAAISIRFPGTERLSFDELVRGGLCDARTANLLKRAVRKKLNLLVTGATGSGKTTLLAALLGEVDPRERIITIEDVQELRIAHPHHLALETRQSNTEGAGGIDLDQLLMQTLRMRPDRIVVGECRGKEIVTLLSALNTGHNGGAGTLHANRIADVPARLEALGMLGGLSERALARQAHSALQLVIHVRRDEHGHRIDAIAGLSVDENGLLRLDRLDTR